MPPCINSTTGRSDQAGCFASVLSNSSIPGAPRASSVSNTAPAPASTSRAKSGKSFAQDARESRFGQKRTSNLAVSPCRSHEQYASLKFTVDLRHSSIVPRLIARIVSCCFQFDGNPG